MISFADTKARKDLAEQIFNIDASCQTPDLISRNARIFGGQFRASIERCYRARQRRSRLFHEPPMPRSCQHRRFLAIECRGNSRGEQRLQFRNALTGR